MKLEAEEISFCYDNGQKEILNHISLSVQSGERLGVTAPSGFGKTTLCKILAGYEKPASGRVLLDGKDLTQCKGRCPIQMIWQHPEQSIDPRWRMKKVLKEGGVQDSNLIGRLGIRDEWLNRFPAELSGGELQRFCIARALGDRTQILLADEITTMLDLVTQSEIWYVLLEDVQRRGMGMIVVSHSQSLLEKVCTGQMDLTQAETR